MSYPYHAIAVMKYKSPPGAGKLTFVKGDKLTVQESADDEGEWLKGTTADGTEGVFPAAFIERVEAETTLEPLPAQDVVSKGVDSTPLDPGPDQSGSSQLTITQSEVITEEVAVEPVPTPADGTIGTLTEEEEILSETVDEGLGEVVVAETPKEEIVFTIQDPKSEAASSKQDDTPKVAIPVPVAPPAVPTLVQTPESSTPALKSPPTNPKPISIKNETDEEAPKPASFRDRIAAFNKPSASPGPPPPRAAKPAAFRKAMPPPVPANTASKEAEIKEVQPEREFSAADAKASIGKGLSLKERMAALQAGGAAAAPPPPPKPAGTGKVWKRPPAPPPPPPAEEGQEGTSPPPHIPLPMIGRPPILTRTTSGDNDPPENQKVAEEEKKEGAEDQGEMDEEEEERQRRARIAARMAKLGGGMGMGMGMFGPRPPIPASKPPPPPPATIPDAPEAIPGSSPPLDVSPPSNVETSVSAPTTVAMPALPKRAAPPRKKGNKNASSTPVSSPAILKDETAPDVTSLPVEELRGGDTSVRLKDSEDNVDEQPRIEPELLEAQNMEDVEALDQKMQEEREERGSFGVEGLIDQNIMHVDPPISPPPSPPPTTTQAFLSNNDESLPTDKVISEASVSGKVPLSTEETVHPPDPTKQGSNTIPASSPPSSPILHTPSDEEDAESARKTSLAERMAKLGGRAAFAGMPIMGMRPPPKKAPPKQPMEDDSETVKTTASDDFDEERPPALPPPRRGVPMGGVALPGIMPRPPPPISSEEETTRSEEDKNENTEETQSDEEEAPPALPSGRPPPRRLPSQPEPEIFSIVSGDNVQDEPESFSQEDNTPQYTHERSMSSNSRRVSQPPTRRAPTLEQVSNIDDFAQQMDDAFNNSGDVPPPPPGKPPRKSTDVHQPVDIPSGPRSTEAASPPLPSVPHDHHDHHISSSRPRASFDVKSHSGSKAHEVDLALDSRWWRAKPLRAPPSFSLPETRTEITGSSDFQSGVAHFTYQINIVFDDYSRTVVDLSFSDGDKEDHHTTISQNIEPALSPNKLRNELIQFSQTIGSQVWGRARAITDTRPGYLDNVVANIPNALPRVGNSYGLKIFTVSKLSESKHYTLEEIDEPRPGDITAAWDCKFKGKIGSTLKVGSVNEPYFAVVADYDGKKKKIRVFEVNNHGKLDTQSYKLDEFKSGLLAVHRVMDKAILWQQ